MIYFDQKIIDNIVKWIKEEVSKANASGVCVAISGGIDSAVVATLAKLAFKDSSFGVFLDIDSSKSAYLNFQKLVNEIKIKSDFVNLKPTFKQIIKDLKLEDNKKVDDLLKGNIKARLRMNSIYAFAKLNNYLVLGTSNYSEVFLGYFTKWGDVAADIYPLANFKKSEVYKIASLLRIDKTIIEQFPSADLWDGQTDEKELGFKYKDLEDYFISDKNVSKDIKLKIENYHNQSKHKRLNLNSFKVK